MHPTCPVPASLPPHLASSLIRGRTLRTASALAVLTLLAGPVGAQGPSLTGRWTIPSLSSVSSNPGQQATGIHMAWMRGEDDWVTNPSHSHSYLFWWENRDDFCIDPATYSPTSGASSKFHGALYGWRPGGNGSCTSDMMSSGFTRLQLTDSVLDPGGEANGHDIFCSGHTLLHDGRLLVAGGAEAENTGSSKSAIFNPIGTPDQPNVNRWTQLGNMTTPRWYPTVVENAAMMSSAMRG